ncbi:MAG: Ig-like domain-containing protein, partial [Cyclobacteriaceae bacterium]
MTKKYFKILGTIVLLLGCVATTLAQPFNPVDDAYNTLTDVPLSVPLEFGLSANDTTSLGTVPAITGVDDTGIAGMLIVDQSNGSFTYTPSLGFTGTTSFTYTVDDGAGGNTMATVTLLVNDLENFCYVVAQNQVFRNGDPGLLARVDKATGSSTVIGALGAGFFLVETIAFGPGADTLFAINANQLGYIDLATGMFAPAANTIGSGDGSLGTISFDDVDGLTFDPISRHLLGTVRENGNNLDLLIMIDRQTGQHVPDAFGTGVDYVVVSGVLGDIDDIAYNPINRSIFAISNINGNNDELVEIDRTTGVATSIGTVTTANDMEGFGFDNSGLLYGTTGKDADIAIDRNSFWSLNITNGLGTK